MKLTLTLIALALCLSAHAQGPAHGRSGASGGERTGAPSHAAQSAQSASTAQQGQSQGRSVFAPSDTSLVDAFQPWPESEMRQFQRP
jgi:hypothetical protein